MPSFRELLGNFPSQRTSSPIHTLGNLHCFLGLCTPERRLLVVFRKISITNPMLKKSLKSFLGMSFYGVLLYEIKYSNIS
jgi:hypothetical protein